MAAASLASSGLYWVNYDLVDHSMIACGLFFYLVALASAGKYKKMLRGKQ
jgi:hypothetical protein